MPICFSNRYLVCKTAILFSSQKEVIYLEHIFLRMKTKIANRSAINNLKHIDMKIKLNDHSKILEFIGKTDTWFDLHTDVDEATIVFATRENGNVGDERIGEEDWQEAIRLADLINSNFPNYNWEVVSCDEWVNLTLTRLK